MSARDIVAVVPAYRPGPAVVDLVRSLFSQVAGVVVVDDGPPLGDVLDGCAEAGAVVVRHDRNQGIAAALTTGVETARDRWPQVVAVLTVDQDSRLAPDYVERLLASWAQARSAGLRVGLVGPQEVEGLPSRAARTRRGVLLGREPIQSGLLVPLDVLDEVGGLDVGLFIDGVDSDLYLKVLDTGRVVVVAPGTRVGHRLGTGRPVRMLGRTVELTVSAPHRTYYLVRNRVRLVARHARRHPGWAVGQVWGLIRHLVLMLALAPDRRSRLREVVRGLVDGARGVVGMRPARGQARSVARRS